MYQNMESPIFIGGTGRSGTTVLAGILQHHHDIFAILGEIKLIVESYGLISLAKFLSDEWGPTEGHIALKNFKYFSDQLYQFGFRNPLLRSLAKLPLFKNPAFLLRKFPSIRYSAHGVAHVFGEAHFKNCIHELLDKLVHHVDTSKPIDTFGVWNPYYVTNKFKRHEVMDILRKFLRDLFSNPLKIHGKKRWCDDTPANLLRADFLLELYPRMKLIHMLRDPRDVVSSYCHQSWASTEVSVNTHIIKNYIEGWLDIRSRLSADNLLEVRLEDLSQDPERTLRRICDFADLEFTTQLLALDLSASNTGRYKQELDNKQIQIIEKGLRNWMIEKAYL